MSPLVTGLAKGFGFSKIPLSTGDAGFNYEYWISKLSGTGNIYIQGNGVDTSGNVYTIAFLDTTGPIGLTDPFIWKYDTNGNLLWQKFIGTSADEYPQQGSSKLEIDSSGNVYFPIRDSHSTFKVDSSGNTIWAREWNATSAAAQSCMVDSSGNVYTIGYTSGGTRASIIKYNSSGTLQWQKRFGSGGNINYFRCGTLDNSGNIWAAGFYQSNAYFYLQYIEPDGSFGVRKAYSISSTTSLESIVTNPSTSDMYMIGYYRVGTDYQVYTFRFNGSGDLQSIATLNTTTGNDLGVSIALDSSGNVYVSGSQASGSSFIVKYNSSLTLQWQRQVAVSGANYGESLSIDSNDDLYLSLGAGSTFTITMKVPSDGSLTGTYNVGGTTVTYSAASMSASTASFSATSFAATVETPTDSDTAFSYSEVTGTRTSTTIEVA